MPLGKNRDIKKFTWFVCNKGDINMSKNNKSFIDITNIFKRAGIEKNLKLNKEIG